MPLPTLLTITSVPSLWLTGNKRRIGLAANNCPAVMTKASKTSVIFLIVINIYLRDKVNTSVIIRASSSTVYIYTLSDNAH
ncbi:unknown [Prevotella sp. CAG:755]|nr:unknown [Prevotella sp. CAG:755]